MESKIKRALYDASERPGKVFHDPALSVSQVERENVLARVLEYGSKAIRNVIGLNATRAREIVLRARAESEYQSTELAGVMRFRRFSPVCTSLMADGETRAYVYSDLGYRQVEQILAGNTDSSRILAVQKQFPLHWRIAKSAWDQTKGGSLPQSDAVLAQAKSEGRLLLFSSRRSGQDDVIELPEHDFLNRVILVTVLLQSETFLGWCAPIAIEKGKIVCSGATVKELHALGLALCILGESPGVMGTRYSTDRSVEAIPGQLLTGQTSRCGKHSIRGFLSRPGIVIEREVGAEVNDLTDAMSPPKNRIVGVGDCFMLIKPRKFGFGIRFLHGPASAEEVFAALQCGLASASTSVTILRNEYSPNSITFAEWLSMLLDIARQGKSGGPALLNLTMTVFHKSLGKSLRPHSKAPSLSAAVVAGILSNEAAEGALVDLLGRMAHNAPRPNVMTRVYDLALLLVHKLSEVLILSGDAPPAAIFGKVPSLDLRQRAIQLAQAARKKQSAQAINEHHHDAACAPVRFRAYTTSPDSEGAANSQQQKPPQGDARGISSPSHIKRVINSFETTLLKRSYGALTVEQALMDYLQGTCDIDHIIECRRILRRPEDSSLDFPDWIGSKFAAASSIELNYRPLLDSAASSESLTRHIYTMRNLAEIASSELPGMGLLAATLRLDISDPAQLLASIHPSAVFAAAMETAETPECGEGVHLIRSLFGMGESHGATRLFQALAGEDTTNTRLFRLVLAKFCVAILAWGAENQTAGKFQAVVDIGAVGKWRNQLLTGAARDELFKRQAGPSVRRSKIVSESAPGLHREAVQKWESDQRGGDGESDFFE